MRLEATFYKTVEVCREKEREVMDNGEKQTSIFTQHCLHTLVTKVFSCIEYTIYMHGSYPSHFSLFACMVVT